MDVIQRVQMPVIRDTSHYPGQLGIAGSDNSLGLRTNTDAIVLYCDPGHANASDDNDGTNPDGPKATLQDTVDSPFLTNYSMIIVGGSLTESVEILDYTAIASYVTVVGAGPNAIGTTFTPEWTSADAADPCLVCGAVGWRWTGFRFHPPVNAAAVVLPSTQAPYGANAIGIRTIIDHCYFDGLEIGLMGIDLHGAPYDCQILNCQFAYIQNAGNTSRCIDSTNSLFANAYRLRVEGCWFYECDQGIMMNPRGPNVSLFKDNIFSPGGQYPFNGSILDLRGGTRGENVVVGNVLPGDYSNVGGYWANAANPGFWNGNWSNDIAEAEVSATALTIAPPA